MCDYESCPNHTDTCSDNHVLGKRCEKLAKDLDGKAGDDAVKGLGTAQKGQNHEGLSPEMRSINTEKFHFHMSMHDHGEMGKWGWPNRIQQQTEYNNKQNTTTYVTV